MIALCSNCAYYRDSLCRRRAPNMTGWPAAKPGDWCGDHSSTVLPPTKNGDTWSYGRNEPDNTVLADWYLRTDTNEVLIQIWHGDGAGNWIMVMTV